LPLRIEPADRKVKEPELIYVNPRLGSASYLIDGIATGSPAHARLTEHGRQLLQLLIYPQ
jgi:hypothetical protein